MPRPPSRQRPVSANPSNGVFLQSRPLSGAFAKDFNSSMTSLNGMFYFLFFYLYKG